MVENYEMQHTALNIPGKDLDIILTKKFQYQHQLLGVKSLPDQIYFHIEIFLHSLHMLQCQANAD